MQSKLLPLGTVFRLKDAKPLIMITGYYPIKKGSKKVYQYHGIVYPLGVGEKNSMILFDEDVIGEILHMGYEDEDAEKYNTMLHQLVETYAKNEDTLRKDT